LSIVPDVAEYKYVKTGDKITQKVRPLRERQERYKRAVAAITVRTLHEVFEADRSQLAETIAFNGHVDTINSATGKQEYPCLVTLMATRDSFMDRDFTRVDPLACLLDLSASVSKNPAELAPVRPVLEFDMVDPRFIEEANVLTGLDQRPNLMELTPGEFESLITNLFTKMGLETRQTVASRDGGVDCVAFDNRPIFGGKVIIQAKRYKNTVPVSAVRDLFGSVHNEGDRHGVRRARLPWRGNCDRRPRGPHPQPGLAPPSGLPQRAPGAIALQAQRPERTSNDDAGTCLAIGRWSGARAAVSGHARQRRGGTCGRRGQTGRERCRDGEAVRNGHGKSGQNHGRPPRRMAWLKYASRLAILGS
jgi:hypothetical protein